MLDHVSIGTADLARARRFYDAALAPLGYTCLHPSDDALGYGADAAQLWVLATDHPVPADTRSGLHLCLAAPNAAAIDAFHAAALATGGSDNGAPGRRADYGPGYYAAFVIDPDGYRLGAHCEISA